jgi:hypothetical protein
MKDLPRSALTKDHPSRLERPPLPGGLARTPANAAAGPSRRRHGAAGADAARGLAHSLLLRQIGPPLGQRPVRGTGG